MLATVHGETKLSPSRKSLPCWPAFTVLDGAVQGAGRESHQRSYPAVSAVSCNNDWHGKMCPWVQESHAYYNDGQSLSYLL